MSNLSGRGRSKAKNKPIGGRWDFQLPKSRVPQTHGVYVIAWFNEKRPISCGFFSRFVVQFAKPGLESRLEPSSVESGH